MSDDEEVPEFLRLTPEQRKAAWIEKNKGAPPPSKPFAPKPKPDATIDWMTGRDISDT